MRAGPDSDGLLTVHDLAIQIGQRATLGQSMLSASLTADKSVRGAYGQTTYQALVSAGNEGLLSSTLAVIELGKGRYEWGVVALLLLSRCASDWVVNGVIGPPVRIAQSLSIRAIAQSLDAPYASIHRYVSALQEQGLAIVSDNGVAISNDPAVAPAVVAFLVGAHDRLIRLVEDLAPDLPINGAGSVPHRGLLAATLSAALDISLVPYEIAREPVIDWTSKLV